MAVDRYYNFFRIVDTNFQVEASGLKKNTLFTFHFADMDKSAECKPFGKEIGDPLYSDANGKLKFSFYFNFDERTGYTGSHYDDTYYIDGDQLGGDYNQLFYQFDLGTYISPEPRQRTLENLVQLKTGDGKVVASASLTGTSNFNINYMYYAGIGDSNYNSISDFRFWAPQWFLDAYGLDRPNYDGGGGGAV